MTSSLSYGNFMLLGRIHDGQRVTIPKWSKLVQENYLFIIGKPDEFYVLAIALTQKGIDEISKDPPELPRLKSNKQDECPKCGMEYQLCKGEGQ